MEPMTFFKINDLMVMQWFVIAILFGFIIYKASPFIKKTMESYRQTRNHKEAIVKALEEHEERLTNIEELVKRDFIRINKTDAILEKYLLEMNESKAENELIMKGVLACLKGLQEVGANGPTKDAQKEIEDYLIIKTHKEFKKE